MLNSLNEFAPLPTEAPNPENSPNADAPRPSALRLDFGPTTARHDAHVSPPRISPSSQLDAEARTALSMTRAETRDAIKLPAVPTDIPSLPGDTCSSAGA